MKRPFFSVIVPFRNKARTLRACLDALCAQEYPAADWELLAVDNNSSDASAAIAAGCPRLRLLRESRQGAYAARNAGIRAAVGEVLVFTDADTEAPRLWLAAIRKAIEENGYDLLAGWYEPARRAALARQHCALQAERLRTAARDKNPDLFTACAANLAVKRRVFEAEGLFRTDSNSEDMNFAVRCLERGYAAGFEESIAVRRNDIPSDRVYLLKNFIYGCAGGAQRGREGSPAAKLKYAALAARFLLRQAPAGLGALLPCGSYLAGYTLGKTGALSAGRAESLAAAAAGLLAGAEGAAAGEQC